MIIRKRIAITGRVQGVGFRPAVYRLASELKLTGFVRNNSQGVEVQIQGKESRIDGFIEKLNSNTDLAARAEIKTCLSEQIPVDEKEVSFLIRQSHATWQASSQITPDMAVCEQCLCEMTDPVDFRYNYPFINCVNCGPRYSIVKSIPYDRPRTTMAEFKMCPRCAAEYSEIADRRFHAQPVACPACGPEIWLADSKGKVLFNKTAEVIDKTAEMLKNGRIIAIKGIGGFHLAVDASNEEAVETLRQRKLRDQKPFALMARSLETIEKYADLNDTAERLLQSPQAPIVILPAKKNTQLAPSISQGLNTLGFMLCYAPLHHMIFEKGPEVLVMTSGNISDEPLICKNSKAVEKLGSVADYFLMNNREIFRQVDDSIMHIVNGRPVPLRRARGYVPEPIHIRQKSPKDILALGSDLKNTFCFVRQNQLICSEHIGDLKEADIYHHYINSIEHLRQLLEVDPQLVVTDLHPGYISSAYAPNLKIPEVLTVQHHWAHAASVMAENNIEDPVIGIVCDGTGLGTDDAIWGCECLIASLDGFERFGHLAYYDLPGSDKAAKEAIRPVLSLLDQTFGKDFDLSSFRWLTDCIEPDFNIQKMILQQIEANVNCVKTSSLGRVFDAVAAMLRLGNRNNFDAQLPMLLESAIQPHIEQHYGCQILNGNSAKQIDISPMFKQITEDIKNSEDTGVISAKFHNTICAALEKLAIIAAEKTKIRTIVLTGGVFCNRYLLQRLVKLLKKKGFCVLFNEIVPSNDGGISLGQAAIGARHAMRMQENRVFS